MTKETQRMRTQRFLCGASLVVPATMCTPPLLSSKVTGCSCGVQQTRFTHLDPRRKLQGAGLWRCVCKDGGGVEEEYELRRTPEEFPGFAHECKPHCCLGRRIPQR